MSLIPGAQFQFADCTLDSARRTLVCGETAVPLGPKTFDLLLYLVEHHERVVTKDELLSALWPDSYVEERNLSQQVFMLRKALAGSPWVDQLIVTHSGKGYRLGVAVEVRLPEPSALANVSDSAAAGDSLLLHAVETSTTLVVEERTEEPATRPIAQRLLPGTRHGRLVAVALSGVVLLVAVGAGTWGWLDRSRPVMRKVMLAQFRNDTGEPVFDDSLATGLRVELEQTPYIDLLGKAQINATLAQMEKPGNTPLLGDVAREVCMRSNYQVLLSGSISRIGSRYLLMLEATNCATGEVVAAEKKTLSDENDVLSAMDALTGNVRRELGESRHEIKTYSVPLQEATTSSLEALQFYSQASAAFSRGDQKTCQELVEHALKIDPNFPSAWTGLAALYYNRGDFKQAAEYYKRGYDLRMNTTGYERLRIETQYYGSAVFDYDKAVQAMRATVEMHPQMANLWGNMADIYTQMGRYQEAVEAGEHAMQLNPQNSATAPQLALAYMRLNRLDDARRTLAPFEAKGNDTAGGKMILFKIAFLQHDEATMKSASDWTMAHHFAARSHEDLGLAAGARGRLHDAAQEFHAGLLAAQEDHETEIASNLITDEAHYDALLGRPSEARSLLAAHQDSTDALFSAIEFALAGDAATARRYLASPEAANNGSTLHDFIRVPVLRAAVDLDEHNPQAALKDLEVSRSYQLRGLMILFLRARAEAMLGQYAAAEADDQLLLANPGVDPMMPEYTVARLDLARAYAAAGDTAHAAEAYRAFLDEMKTADPGIPAVDQARTELARLHGAGK